MSLQKQADLEYLQNQNRVNLVRDGMNVAGHLIAALYLRRFWNRHLPKLVDGFAFRAQPMGFWAALAAVGTFRRFTWDCNYETKPRKNLARIRQRNERRLKKASRQ